MQTSQHILITVIGSLGDLHPMIALALGLKARGHGVTIATHQLYQERVEREQIEFALLRPEFADTPETYNELFHPQKGPENLMRKYILPSVNDMAEDLMPLVAAADLLVNSPIAYAGPVVADYYQKPWLSVALQPYLFFSSYDPGVISILPSSEHWYNWGFWFWKPFHALMKSTTQSWPKTIYDLQKKLGTPNYGNPIFEGQFSSLGTLALFSNQIATTQPDWPANTHPTGFVFYDRLTENDALPSEVQHFLESGPPPIVFTLGSSVVKTSTHFYTASIQAIEQLGYRAIFLAGDREPALPLNKNMLWWDALPHSALFPYAAAVVHQGGMGTTAQVMRAGKPMIIVPHGFDQPDNAARLKRLGISKTLYPAEYNTQNIISALKAILETPAYQTKARIVAQVLSQEEGLKQACDQIEAVLNQQSEK